MKKLFLIIFLLILSSANITKANNNIVFIDMDKVISTSKVGSSVLKQLNELNNKNIKNFKDEEKKLKVKETKLIAQKNILSEVEFKSIVDKLKLEIKKHAENKNQFLSDFTKLKFANTNKLIELITPILTAYSKEKSISMILQKKDLVIGKSELDISDEIIKIVNSNINEFKIK
jgi:Skp family chaperone for outer membrane proteins